MPVVLQFIRIAAVQLPQDWHYVNQLAALDELSTASDSFTMSGVSITRLHT